MTTTNLSRAREAAVKRVLAGMYETTADPAKRAVAEKAAGAAWDAGRRYEARECARLVKRVGEQFPDDFGKFDGALKARLAIESERVRAPKAAAKKKGPTT